MIRAGGYTLYEYESGEDEKAKADTIRFLISFVPVASGIQITGSSGGTGGSITNGGALVLSGSGELAFAFSGEISVEQGLIMMERVSGNPSSGSGSEKAEEKSQEETDKESQNKNGLPKQAGREQSRGGHHEPLDLNEKLAMEEVMTNPSKGAILDDLNTDSRWHQSDGWIKMAQHVHGYEIHYQYNSITQEIDDVKIK